MIGVRPKNGRDFKLKELYSHIGCDCVEFVRLATGQRMVVDESGKLKENPVVNELATELYLTGKIKLTTEEIKEKYKVDFVEYLTDPLPDKICGDVLVCDYNMIK